MKAMDDREVFRFCMEGWLSCCEIIGEYGLNGCRIRNIFKFYDTTVHP